MSGEPMEGDDLIYAAEMIKRGLDIIAQELQRLANIEEERLDRELDREEEEARRS